MGGWVGVVGGRVGRDGVVKNSRNFPGNFFRFSGSSQEISIVKKNMVEIG